MQLSTREWGQQYWWQSTHFMKCLDYSTLQNPETKEHLIYGMQQILRNDGC